MPAIPEGELVLDLAVVQAYLVPLTLVLLRFERVGALSMMEGVMRGLLRQAGSRLRRRLLSLRDPLWKMLFWDRSCPHELLSLPLHKSRLVARGWPRTGVESGYLALVTRDDLFDGGAVLRV